MSRSTGGGRISVPSLTVPNFTLNLLCNREVLAINQDSRGFQAHCILEIRKNDPNGNSMTHYSVYKKGMSDGSYAIGNVWRNEILGKYDNQMTVEIPRHGALLLRFQKP
jgi:hypothetical protein